ncbi:aminotransferase class IV [Nocardioidaceae bacterium SCSIO 66511]|nr:aminotransferase class IV [Nocardioidaceae bacterium SCSIO 66511]
MQSGLQVFVSDRVVPLAEAAVSVFDAGFQSGDAVWEGMRVYNGRVLKLDRHLRRLEQSANALRIRLPYDAAGIADAVHRTLEANGFTDDAHIRLMVTRGSRSTSGMDPRNAPESGTLVIVAEHKPVDERPAPQRLRTASIRRPHPQVVDASIHHANQLNSILARLEILDQPEIDATLMLDAFGYVAEADTANIFLVSEGKVRTPFATSCLHGITRETVLDLAVAAGYETAEAQLTLFDFYSADEVLVTGTVCELVPVVEIDARRIGTGEPGPVWWDLLSRYRAQVKELTR